jgi:predicted GNAT family N-acyltransferase
MAETWRIERVDWPQQRAQLLGIRFRVFVDEQGVPPDMEEDEHDAQALHLLARNARGEAIGCARLLDDGQIGRMAVLQVYRCRGIGSRLLQQLLQCAAQNGLPRVFLHAQCHAEDFYRRAGFTPVGEVFMEAGIPHREMHRPLQPPGLA